MCILVLLLGLSVVSSQHHHDHHCVTEQPISHHHGRPGPHGEPGPPGELGPQGMMGPPGIGATGPSGVPAPFALVPGAAEFGWINFTGNASGPVSLDQIDAIMAANINQTIGDPIPVDPLCDRYYTFTKILDTINITVFNFSTTGSFMELNPGYIYAVSYQLTSMVDSVMSNALFISNTTNRSDFVAASDTVSLSFYPGTMTTGLVFVNASVTTYVALGDLNVGADNCFTGVSGYLLRLTVQRADFANATTYA